MSTKEFNKKFPTLTKDVPFDDFITGLVGNGQTSNKYRTGQHGQIRGKFYIFPRFCYSQADPDNQTVLYNAFESILLNTLILTMSEKPKKSKLSFEDACFQWASGFYLTEHLPNEWFLDSDPEEELTDEEWEEYKDEVLEEKLWEPFQFYDANQIAKEISSLAYWIQNGEYPKKEDYEN